MIIGTTPYPHYSNLPSSGNIPGGQALPSHLETHEHASTCAPMAVSLEKIANELHIISVFIMVGIITATSITMGIAILWIFK